MPGKIYITMPTLKKLSPTNRQTHTTVLLHNQFVLCLYFVSVLCKLFYQLFLYPLAYTCFLMLSTNKVKYNNLAKPMKSSEQDICTYSMYR